MDNKTTIQRKIPLPGYMTSELLETMLFSDRRKTDRGLPKIPYQHGGTVVVAKAGALGELQRSIYKTVVRRSLRHPESGVTLHKNDISNNLAPNELRETIAKLTTVNIIHIIDTEQYVIPLIRCSYASDETFTLSLAPEIKHIYSDDSRK